MSDNGPYFVEIRRTGQDQPSYEAYDALYSAAGLSQIASYYLWLWDVMRIPAGAAMLDVSAGAGELVRLANQRGARAIGIDISVVVARVAQRNLGAPGGMVVGAGETMPFADHSFDVVTNIGSLEHFVEPARGVREMARILRPGGQAFVLVPNTFSLLSNVWNAFRKGVTSADEQPIQRYGARMDWELLLAGNGLKVRKVTKYERPRPRSLADCYYYIRHPKDILRWVAGPVIPLNLAYCFLFTCEPDTQGKREAGKW